MKRRDFLKNSFLTVLGGAGMPGLFSSIAEAAISKGKILVVVELTGGNDALNTLIPYSNDIYYHNRPSLAVSKKDVLSLSSDVGLHPSLKPWMKLWDDGELALIQGVGHPKPNRSHFESMAIWHTADPNSRELDGWVARIAEKYGDPFCATNFGGSTPRALRSDELILPTIGSIDRFQLKVPAEIEKFYQQMLNEPMTGRADVLRQSTAQMFADIDKVQKGVTKYKPGASYPTSALADKLRDISRLISADVGPRVFYTSQGGYDTHAGQPLDHPELLDTLSSALLAFRSDLRAQGKEDEVIVIGFSEFGRRLAENASSGTDHGKAGMMFALGKQVKGGLFGEYPDLAKLDDGDPRFTTDFRQVYATVLDRWMNISSRDILAGDFKPMGFVN
jgi:uncharacterized protein (DUF1501 family)